MPSRHKNRTISFRPSSSWQYTMIQERAKLSGLHKKDYITRCCIYSNICVIGKRENIQRIVDALQQMQLVLQEITSQLLAGDVFLSNEAYIEFKEDYLALIITAVDIVNGAAYLFQKIPSSDNHHWKADLKIEQFRKVLESDKKSGCENQENGI